MLTILFFNCFVFDLWYKHVLIDKGILNSLINALIDFLICKFLSDADYQVFLRFKTYLLPFNFLINKIKYLFLYFKTNRVFSLNTKMYIITARTTKI